MLCTFILLVSLFCTFTHSSSFHLTNSLTGVWPNGVSCHPDVSSFRKGVACCYDSNNDGTIDECSSLNTNDNTCFTNHTKNTEDYLYYTYNEAELLCQNIGRKLCHRDEYQTLCPRDDVNCGVNNLEAWVAEGCSPVYKARRCFEKDTDFLSGITDRAGVRCCTVLGDGSENAICSSEDTNSVCYTELATYSDATLICENDGRRLCDFKVVQQWSPSTSPSLAPTGTHYGCCGTGCDLDNDYVLSRTLTDWDTVVPTAATTEPSVQPTHSTIPEHIPLKGLSFSSKQSPDVLDYTLTNSFWNYNWGALPLFPDDPVMSETFVPMIWGRNGCSKWCDGLKGTNYDALLGFNEPDNPNQANMEVSEALDIWPDLMETGLRLGSPATTQSETFTWLQEFMDGAKQRNYTVDFIAVHWYSKNPNNLKAFLDNVYSTYGLPVWLTEFSYYDSGSENVLGTRGDQVNFWNSFYPLLTEMPYLERICWFTDRYRENLTTARTLVYPNGALTKLGEEYSKYPRTNEGTTTTDEPTTANGGPASGGESEPDTASSESDSNNKFWSNPKIIFVGLLIGVIITTIIGVSFYSHKVKPFIHQKIRYSQTSIEIDENESEESLHY